MTRYTYIKPMQEPFDLGMDANNRALWAFNALAHCEFTFEFLEEIAELLEDAGVGYFHSGGHPVAGAILLSSKATVGVGAGPFLTLVHTPGLGPDHTMNQRSPPAYIQPGLQLTARGASSTAARLLAHNAYLTLLDVVNADIGSVPPFPLTVIPEGSGPMRARLWRDTSDMSSAELFLDGASARLTIASGLTVGFEATVVGRGTGGATHIHAIVEGTIRNNGGSVAIVGSTSLRTVSRSDPSWSWPIATADDTNDALVITVAGGPGHWEADVILRRVSA